ncbi:MAG TPA: BON domain-containing protein [Stellaceae bacterium]|nr:BON domain-containing protein [Stellaceae bacterium]
MTGRSEDMKLRQNVLDELEWEPSLDAAHVGVAARAGVVTLSGHVASFAEKLAAERAAWRVAGVRAVAQEIEVRLPSDRKNSDEEIAARALRMLEWDVAVPHERITVKVDHGLVTLDGEVEWGYQRDEAEDDVRRLNGVKGVINSIKVKPSVGAADVQAQIRRAFERSAELEADHITVAVENGKVVLGGKVSAWIERELAERAAWAAPGVTGVDNQIVIGRP